jgi:hypothetical protein
MEADDREGRCPFCNAPWTSAMYDQLDAATIPGGCACCGDVALPLLHKPMPIGPQDDLKCASCGRVIYRAVAIDS